MCGAVQRQACIHLSVVCLTSEATLIKENDGDEDTRLAPLHISGDY